MREKTFTISSVLILSVLMVFVSGCAVNRVSLVDTHQVSVARQDSEKIKILWTDIYQKDGQTWAYGVLKQSSSVGGTLKAHVDVQVVSPDGSLQYETISKELYVPRKRIGRMDWKRFRVQLPTEISEGSNISITVHVGKHTENSVSMEGIS
jgi:hypothetical protein